MPRIATIGFFDGVHRGHRFLFAQLHEHAKLLHLSPVIYTFFQHPKQILTGQSPAMLTTNTEREALLRAYGEVYFLDFAAVQHLTAEQFMHYLHEEQDVDALLIGYDHHFGSDRLKGFAEYEKIARKIGLHVERAHECLVDGLPVSSTRIRKLLLEGHIHEVNRLLNYNYSLTGMVVHGNHIGTKIGFPTANIQLNTDKLLPSFGVYAAHVQIEEQGYVAIVNVGNNPTVGNPTVSVEAYIMNFNGDLYGKNITISFYEFLRHEQKFASIEELKAQIKKDIQSLQ